MAMTDQEQKDIRAYCAFILKEHGFHISPGDPIIPALYIIHKEMLLTSQSNKALELMIKDAAAKINPTVFHFVSPGEAFRFQLGVALKWIIVSIPFLLLVCISVWSWSISKDIEQARTIIKTSANVGELARRSQINNDGYCFIDFTLATGDSIRYFEEFNYLTKKKIRVYLGRTSK